MTGNNKFWRASLAGLASVAMLATMGVSAANAAGSGSGFTGDNGTFQVKVYTTGEPDQVATSGVTGNVDQFSGYTYGQPFTAPAEADPYAKAGDGKVLTGYSYDRAGKQAVTFPIAITGDTKLYAQYADAVKVTFVDSTKTSAGVHAANKVTVNGAVDVAKGTALTADAYEDAVTEPSVTFDSAPALVGWTKTDSRTAEDFYTNQTLDADTTLYARYDSDQNKAAVQFQKAANRGQVVNRYTLNGTAYPAFRAPSAAQQANFKEWQTTDGKKYDFTAKVANSNANDNEADLTIVAAAYTADESVDVTFDFNGNASGVNPTLAHTSYTTGVDEKIAEPATPALEGAVFTGWFLEGDASKPFDFSKPIKDQAGFNEQKKSIKIVAGWDTTNIARLVYKLQYKSWTNAEQIQYVNARGEVKLLEGLEDYTKADDGSINPTKLSGWLVNGTGNAVTQTAAPADRDTMTLTANWSKAVAVWLDADGGYFSNGAQNKYVLLDENAKLANAEGYEVPSKDGYTFKYWTVNAPNGPQFNTVSDSVSDGLHLVANYDNTGLQSVVSLHQQPEVPAGNKELAYDQYKTNGYTEASWKAYVDTWYQLQDEWDAYVEAYYYGTSPQDAINKGNALAKKYADAQAKLVKANVPSVPGAQKVSVYRLFNPYEKVGTTHLFTTSLDEYNDLTAKGWQGEGEVFKATTDEKATPVYRLYNKYDGSHHYTTSVKERDDLVKIGWTYEFVAFYAPADGDATVYRLFNQYNSEHFYTTDKAEYDSLVKIGWTGENEAFKAYAK